MGEEREGKEMGGWLLCSDLPFFIRSLVISTHRKKCLLARVSDWRSINNDKVRILYIISRKCFF